jgi:gas vesicle protein
MEAVMSNLEIQQETGSKFFKGFILGGLVGAAIALAFAPKTGRELREEMKKRSAGLLDDETLNDVRAKAEKVLADGRKKAEELIQEAESRLEQAKAKASDLLKRTGKEVAESIEDTLEEASETVSDAKIKVTSKRKKVQDAIKAGIDAFDKTREGFGKKSEA